MAGKRRRKSRIISSSLVTSKGLSKEHSDDGGFQPSYIPRFTTPEKFIDDKILMLEEQFYITLSYEEKKHLRELKTEHEINAAIKEIINEHWG